MRRASKARQRGAFGKDLAAQAPVSARAVVLHYVEENRFQRRAEEQKRMRALRKRLAVMRLERSASPKREAAPAETSWARKALGKLAGRWARKAG